MSKEFVERFVSNLVRDAYSVVTRNDDWLRFGAEWNKRALQRVKDVLALCLHRLQLVRCNYERDHLAFIMTNLEAFNAFYDLLNDEASKEIMLKLLEFRVLGPRHVKLPLNTSAFWDEYNTIDAKYARKRGTQKVWDRRFLLNRYEMPIRDTQVTVDLHPLCILGTFLLEQYAYKKGSEQLFVKAGDYVIDGGGCHGDTALYFAANAGSSGSVLSFEFVEENVRLFKENLAQNQELARRITLITKGLWHCSGETLSFENNGPATQLSAEGNERCVNKIETIAIDDLVLTGRLPRVDFIKMDIEGSEMNALQGACETIKRFRPTLAISVYHKKDDFITIPRWIHSLGMGYRFYLDHFTIHHEETVLFATAR